MIRKKLLNLSNPSGTNHIRGAEAMRYVRLALVILVGSCITASAETPTKSCHAQGEAYGNLPVAVDGAVTPQEIPDYLAYRHLIIVVAEHETPSAEEIAQRKANFAKMRIVRTDDQAALKLAVRGVRERLNSIDKAREGLRPDSRASHQAFVALQRQQNQLLDSIRDQLSQSLSQEGLTSLDTYIREYVKRRIVIYGERPQGQ